MKLIILQEKEEPEEPRECVMDDLPQQDTEEEQCDIIVKTSNSIKKHCSVNRARLLPERNG